MKTVLISRFYGNEKQSLGTCTVLENNIPLFSSLSLERGDLHNQPNISCIPEGGYPLVLEYSNRFKKDLWEVKEVPNRSECKFHAANFWHQLNGCIALGVSLTDMDNDGYLDITQSSKTMARFHSALKGTTNAQLVIHSLSDSYT